MEIPKVAYSYVRYTGNGTTTNYTFAFSYISSDHIKVRVNNTLVTNWSFLNASTIQFLSAPTNGTIVEIRRETPKDVPPVNFTDGSVLLERDLDLLATWELYVAQETEDAVGFALTQDFQGNFDAKSKRVINVADPVNTQDAVTKNYFENRINEVAQPYVDAAAAEADAAAASAVASASSATASAGSASAAASSAAAAAASYDSFDDRYLGAKSVAPTVDNDGNTLLVGATYWDTGSNQMFVWNGTQWRPTYVIGQTTRSVVTATAGQTVVNSPTYITGSDTLQVFLNGVKQVVGTDYNETTQNSITFASGLAIGDEVELIAQQAFLTDELRSDLASTATGKGSALVGFKQSGTGAGQRTVQDKLREVVSVKDFGASLDGVTNDATALLNANAAAVAAKVPLLINGVMHISTVVTVTAPVVDGMHQMFSTTSQVTINNGQPVRPEWWGNTAEAGKYAVNALPSTGGVVKFANKRYDSPYSGPFGSAAYLGDTWLDKANVKFVGEKMPEFKSDNTQLIDGSGTIINGVLNVWAENFEIENIGFDCGTVQRARLGLSKTQDGLVLAPPVQTLGYFRRKGTIRNVVSLGVLANDFGHNILFEGYQGGTIENCEARCAIHGIVIKSSGINGNNLTALGHSSENFIIKSDNYGVQVGCNLTNLYAKPLAGNTPLYGIFVLAANAGGGNVNISNAEVTSGAMSGIRIESSASNVLYTTNLSNIIVDGSEHGIYAFGASQTWYLNVNNASIKNATIGVVEQGNVRINNYNNINLVNVTTGFNTIGDPLINNVWCKNVTTFMNYSGSAKPTVGLLEYLDLTNYDNLATPKFLNGWTNVGGTNPVFDVFMRNGKVNLSGLVKPGTNSRMCTLPVNFCPPAPLYFPAHASNGAAFVVVDSNGDVYVETTAGATWVTLQNVSYVVH